MANGINIKNLPEVDSILPNDKFIFDRYVSGTQIVPFSSFVIGATQVTFYTDFLNLSSYSQSNITSLSSSLNTISNNINALSSNLSVLSSNVASNIFFLNVNQTNTTNNVSALNTVLNSTTANLISLSSNYLVDFSSLESRINTVSTTVANLSSNVFFLLSSTSTFLSGGLSPSGAFIPQKVGIFYLAADTKDIFVSIDTNNSKNWRRILTVDY
jgi:hypothetical protein